MPTAPGARLLLFAFRRLGAHGLDDTAAAQAMLATFGQGFRRPLVLMRAMMADLAASAVAPISIAPCCCVRATHAEHAMLTILARAETAPDSARLLLADLLGIRHADGVFACVMAVATAFADAGRPIEVELASLSTHHPGGGRGPVGKAVQWCAASRYLRAQTGPRPSPGW